MPSMDKTGPLGTGPNGSGRGGCRQSGELFRGPQEQRCHGRGKGFGRSRGCCAHKGRTPEVLSRDEEIASLETQIAEIQSRLNALK
ncbi:MAG: DUF5320 domain-containing protein [Alphaproteobacteria bacterium]|nr:DUF5320 domain-containing protein [Alphaproteobacteria bacterium]